MKKIILTLLVVVGFVSNSYCTEKRSKSSVAELKSSIVEVSSIKELLPYLRQNDVTLKMKPGTYRVTTADVQSGLFHRTTEVIEGQTTYALILIEGNNNIFDFSGVTIEVESTVPNSFEGRRYEFAELHATGHNNVVKGL